MMGDTKQEEDHQNPAWVSSNLHEERGHQQDRRLDTGDRHVTLLLH